MPEEIFIKICWIWIGLAAVIFPIVLLIPQPYGKHSKNTWGPMIKNRTGWFLMEIPALLVYFSYALSKTELSNISIIIIPALWGIHYIHRSIIYPIRIKTSKKMPVIIVVFGIFFNTVNGFLNGYWLLNYVSPGSTEFFFSPHIIIGTLIFLVGFAINKYHDRLLIKLRDSQGKGYKIPYGGLFRYVSCPNFLGEIITWLGFYIVCDNLPALSFLIWTIVNLVPRALDHHRWYKKEFEDYPKERKAVVPFVL